MWNRRLLTVAVVSSLVLVVHALWFRGLFRGNAVDDAYISFRYGDNLVHGHGLVFNPGERVEGYSNFLWVMAMAPAIAGTGDPTLFAQVLGLAASVRSEERRVGKE